MGALKIMFKNLPIHLHSVGNQKHILTQSLLVVSEHCQDGEGGKNTKFPKQQFFP